MDHTAFVAVYWVARLETLAKTFPNTPMMDEYNRVSDTINSARILRSTLYIKKDKNGGRH